jgi:diketogulonate reductase-like aldo/keto reductase
LTEAGSGKGGIMEDAVVKGIAKKHTKTPAQVLLRWAVQRETCVLPKSVHSNRIDENFDIWDFKLTEEEMKSIAGNGAILSLSLFSRIGQKSNRC